jgi:hypothetical protein
MKGATAEPCVKTIRPPRSTIITSIGAIQNFLRTRMKVQSSPMKDILINLSQKPELIVSQNWLRIEETLWSSLLRSIQ